MARAEDTVAITQSGGYKDLTSTAVDATPTVKGVAKQAAFVSDPAVLTAAAAVGANPTKAEFDALLADVTALRTKLIAVLASLHSAANKPMATS